MVRLHSNLMGLTHIDETFPFQTLHSEALSQSEHKSLVQFASVPVTLTPLVVHFEAIQQPYLLVMHQTVPLYGL